MMQYHEQIKHPLWQKKRLEVLQINDYRCEKCGDSQSQLHVHHPFYRRGAMIWDYSARELMCLCNRCHKDEHAIDEKIKININIMSALYGNDYKKRILGYIEGIVAEMLAGAVVCKEYFGDEQYQSGFMDGFGNSPFETFAEVAVYLTGVEK